MATQLPLSLVIPVGAESWSRSMTDCLGGRFGPSAELLLPKSGHHCLLHD